MKYELKMRELKEYFAPMEHIVFTNSQIRIRYEWKKYLKIKKKKAAIKKKKEEI